MSDLTLPDAREQRNSLASRTDVLDKVGALRQYPNDMHAGIDHVANFFEVHVDAIEKVIRANRDELEADGLLVVTGPRLSAFKAECGLRSRASSLTLLPRRAVLRVGMLLRDSGPARLLRSYLLDTERDSLALSEDEIVAQALAITTRRVEALTARVAELEPKAELADAYLTADAGSRLVGEAAKILGMKEKELRAFLLSERLIFVRHAACGNVQYDHYSEFAPHFEARETVVNHTWGSCNHYTLRITPRGIDLIRKRIRRQEAA
ncbi:hypothetical protein GS532_22285 [Rhodococcus hoagii]|nr:hypothetical protein [Prescottella equi]